MILTIKLRLRDKHRRELNRQSRAVNFVWNFCNETQRKAAAWGRKWLSGYDLQRLTSGSSKELALSSKTIEKVCDRYAISRSKRPWLRWRGKKSLGWVPFGFEAVRFDGQWFVFRGVRYEPMHLREIPVGLLKEGSFNADARGRWYINVAVEVADNGKAIGNAVGIDLGLSALATLSTGEKIEAPQHYRQLEKRLGKAQRARKRKLKQTISAKIANARKDYLHKVSAGLAKTHGLIFVGNVSSSKLTQTRMAKSVLDAGWSTLRNQLSYKAIRHGGMVIEVDERFTSQVCSSCGAIPEGRPKGIADLGIRRWQCGDCGATHDRDVNAALNIVARGLASLAEGARIDRAQSTRLA